MSRYIRKRVFYHCDYCNKPFTINKNCVDDWKYSDNIFCSRKCYERFKNLIHKNKENENTTKSL